MSARRRRFAAAALLIAVDLQGVHLSPIADFSFLKDVRRVPVRVQ